MVKKGLFVLWLWFNFICSLFSVYCSLFKSEHSTHNGPQHLIIYYFIYWQKLYWWHFLAPGFFWHCVLSVIQYRIRSDMMALSSGGQSVIRNRKQMYIFHNKFFLFICIVQMIFFVPIIHRFPFFVAETIILFAVSHQSMDANFRQENTGNKENNHIELRTI